MILIADSGSTKTDYRLIDHQGKVQQFKSAGLNPNFHTTESIRLILDHTFKTETITNVEQVFFYGAGCSSDSKKNIVEYAFNKVFINADCMIEHDLLGAARATCVKLEGLVGILGTGSNCCFYNGTIITKEIPSSGYILGDEGGGVCMGKLLIKNVIEESLPQDLAGLFQKRYKLSKDNIINSIYKEPQPNKFLASFAMFIFHHREHPFIHQIIQINFKHYFEAQVKRFKEYRTHPLNLVGSIAYYFQDIIRSIAIDEEVTIGTIIEKPIAGLTLFHHPNPEF